MGLSPFLGSHHEGSHRDAAPNPTGGLGMEGREITFWSAGGLWVNTLGWSLSPGPGAGGFSSPGLECCSAAQGWNAFCYLEKANVNEWTEG